MQFHDFLKMPILWSSSLNASVVRRGVALLAITGPAALLNLGLSYLASKTLSAEDFGIYYTAITIINVAFAPATIMNMFFTRAITTVGAEHGMDRATESAEKVFRLISSWGAVAALTLISASSLAWGLGAGFSVLVACAIAFVVYISYCAEVGRISLQSNGRFFSLGIFTLGWMTSRFIGGALGIYMLNNVWGGLVGIGLATLAPIVVLFKPWRMVGSRFFHPWAKERGGDSDLLSMIRISSFLKLSVGFLLFMVVANADVLLAYVVLAPEQLSVYSASAVLPKGMLVLTLPLIQLLFPLIVGERASARPTRMLILRGVFLTVGISSAGALMIFLLSEPLCSSSYGIASCNGDVMLLGLLAIVAMCTLRLAIAIDYASHLDLIPLTLILSLGGGMALIAEVSWSPTSLAKGYVFFSIATLIGYGVVSLAVRLIQRRTLGKTSPKAPAAN